jgi:hypothetical protein
VGEETTPTEPEGRVKRVTGYGIDLEGSAAVEQVGHVRFSFRGEFGPNNAWKVLNLRATMRPLTWELRAVAAEDTVQLKGEDGDQKWQRTFRLSELRDPSKLLQQTGPMPGSLLGGFPTLPLEGGLSPDLLGFKWNAHQDWMRVGRTRIRAYRLEGRLLDEYRAVILVSRVGELLRVELPGQIQLVNESLPDF